MNCAIVSDSEPILNNTLNTKVNRLYQCQSKISFIIIQGRIFTTYPGHDGLLRHTQVWTQFYDMPGHVQPLNAIRKSSYFMLRSPHQARKLVKNKNYHEHFFS